MHRARRICEHLMLPANGQINLNEVAAAFQYSRGGGILTQQQRQSYEQNGFILIKNLIPADRIQLYTQRFLDIANGVVERQPTMLMMRDVTVAKLKGMGEKSITKLQDFQDDEILFQYCAEPVMLPIVQSLIGDDVKSMHTMLINKPPDTGKGSSRHPPHQDLWYFPFRPAERIVATWTAMQRIDATNGCLCVVPGSHRGQLFKHEYPNDGVVNKAYHGIQGLTEADALKMVNVEMDVGDTIFFHPLLVHGSGRNNSTGYRKAISCHYASCDCHFIEVSGTMQEDIAREVEHMAKSKSGMDISFMDVWKFKSRLVFGKEKDFC